MKRILSAFLAISLVTAVFSACPAANALEINPETVQKLVFGEEITYTFLSPEDTDTPSCLFSFTPESDGDYQFNFTNNYKKAYMFYTRVYAGEKNLKKDKYTDYDGECYSSGKEYKNINPHFYVYHLKKDVTYYLYAYVLVDGIKKMKVPATVIKHIHDYKDYFTYPVSEEPGDIPGGEYGKVCKTCYHEKNIRTYKVPLNPVISVKAGKRSFTSKWKSVKGSKGYQLQYSTSKKFRNKKTKETSNLKLKVKKLKKKKTYYIRVRAFKIIQGHKIYSEWSNYKKIKTK